MNSYSYISNAHPAFIESLYNDFKAQSVSLDTSWKKFFEGFEYALNGGHSLTTNNLTSIDENVLAQELKVYNLIQAYRQKGHLLAKTNPIRDRKDRDARLNFLDFELTQTDLETKFAVGSELGLYNATLQQIIDRLQYIYTQSIGIEYTYITDKNQLNWLKQKIEDPDNANKGNQVAYGYSLEKKKYILQKLNETNIFERFLGDRFVGAKRFSIEGGETTIPALDAIINHGATLGSQEFVIGMAHRGRLNILANIMQKTYDHIFNEFQGTVPNNLTMGSGDVKYHLGYSSQITTPNGNSVYLKLLPNPSHLEAVNPVVEGYVRAKADIIYNNEYKKIVPILIHGDAAVAGLGIVYETLQMSQLQGYQTGGTVHFVINNQIGFTTDFIDARSADYCTSLAAMIKAPVFHVNGDDVEAVVFIAELATEFRQQFNTDVFIDMVCYRKHGHNEGDDPKFTQPNMYNLIKNHKNPREIYSELLVNRKDIDAEAAKKMEIEFREQLQQRLDGVKEKPLPYQYQQPELDWKDLTKKVSQADIEKHYKTGISQKNIDVLVQGLLQIPENFTPLKQIQKMLADKQKSLKEQKIINWADAELMAYGATLLDGHNVRISGEDVKRGTFSHRHAVLCDEQNNTEYNRLNYLSQNQGKFMIYNSLLSEFAVMGFEFGYAMASPNTLTIWEAQFGDFANGAQTIIDQFIVSAESKWQRNNGLVLLLPHGSEGQGPEHSSARLERFLQMCAEYNITVANITTPANFFHAIRRQQVRPFRKPLVVMTPKSLLREPLCVSSISEINGNSYFKEFIDDTLTPNNVRKLVFCSGKLYYDLLKYRQNNNINNVALIRVEQLYPFIYSQFQAIVAQYPPNTPIVWAQEEPYNMGAAWYMYSQLKNVNFEIISRPAAAAPATGYTKIHEIEQEKIKQQVFA